MLDNVGGGGVGKRKARCWTATERELLQISVWQVNASVPYLQSSFGFLGVVVGVSKLKIPWRIKHFIVADMIVEVLIFIQKEIAVAFNHFVYNIATYVSV